MFEIQIQLSFLIVANSLSFNLLTSIPSSRYRPEVGVSRQPSIFIKVDFPGPEGPIIAINSPSFTSGQFLLSVYFNLAIFILLLYFQFL